MVTNRIKDQLSMATSAIMVREIIMTGQAGQFILLK